MHEGLQLVDLVCAFPDTTPSPSTRAVDGLSARPSVPLRGFDNLKGSNTLHR